MCCNNMWCYTDVSHCEWAVCGYEGFFGVGFTVVCRYSSVCNQIKIHTVAAGRLLCPVGRWCVHGWVRFTTGPVSSRVGREIKNIKSDI